MILKIKNTISLFIRIYDQLIDPLNTADIDASSLAPCSSSLGFAYRIIKHKKRQSMCEEDHNWELIYGHGYDYESDYYQCKKCERKIYRYDLDN